MYHQNVHEILQAYQTYARARLAFLAAIATHSSCRDPLAEFSERLVAQLQAAIVFKRETIGAVCRLLQKRHPHQETTLQLTRRNYALIRAKPGLFRACGVEVFSFEQPDL